MTSVFHAPTAPARWRSRAFPSVPRGGPVVACLLAAGMVWAPRPALGQQIAGEYEVVVEGSAYYLDREPDRRALRDRTTLTIKQDGDRIALEFGTFASAMSATAFHGRVGNDRFVALWSSASSGGRSRLILGRVVEGGLRGRLIDPRAAADATVPGWTEISFRAERRPSAARDSDAVALPSERPSAGKRPLRPRTPRDARWEPRPHAVPAEAGERDPFQVQITAVTEPAAPVAGRRVDVLARATAQAGETVARMELWIDGLIRGSSEESVLDVRAGPFEPGRVDYEIVAVSADGRRSDPWRETLVVAPAGRTVVSGRITGRPAMVTDVQLLTPEERVVARSPVDGDGRYRFSGLSAGVYWIFVNDGKREAWISPAASVRIQVDGTSGYTRDFEVR